MVPRVSRIISNLNAHSAAKVTASTLSYELLTFILGTFDLIALCAKALKDSMGSQEIVDRLQSERGCVL